MCGQQAARARARARYRGVAALIVVVVVAAVAAAAAAAAARVFSPCSRCTNSRSHRRRRRLLLFALCVGTFDDNFPLLGTYQTTPNRHDARRQSQIHSGQGWSSATSVHYGDVRKRASTRKRDVWCKQEEIARAFFCFLARSNNLANFSSRLKARSIENSVELLHRAAAHATQQARARLTLAGYLLLRVRAFDVTTLICSGSDRSVCWLARARARTRCAFFVSSHCVARIAAHRQLLAPANGRRAASDAFRRHRAIFTLNMRARIRFLVRKTVEYFARAR